MTSERTKTALAVFAHSDDETLLAGALIPKLIHDGWTVHLLCIAPGDDEDRSQRMELAAAELGIASVSSLRFAAAGSSSAKSTASPPLLSAPELVVASQIAGKIAELSPGMIITHSPSGDYGHPDHAFCHRVTVIAAREGAPSAVVFALAWPRVMLGLNGLAGRVINLVSRSGNENLTTGDPSSTVHLPITETHDVARFLPTRKRAAQHYRAELSQGPFPLRMLEAAPTWLQRPVLGKARLSRVRL